MHARGIRIRDWCKGFGPGVKPVRNNVSQLMQFCTSMNCAMTSSESCLTPAAKASQVKNVVHIHNFRNSKI